MRAATSRPDTVQEHHTERLPPEPWEDGPTVDDQTPDEMPDAPTAKHFIVWMDDVPDFNTPAPQLLSPD
jgi:hypothetical protein